MTLVSIYSVGSCDTATREGAAEVLLEHPAKVKHLHLQFRDTTVNRCIIEGLIEAVRQLKKPCIVRLVTSTKIGAEKARRGKGVNVDLVRKLVNLLREKQCAFDFDVWEGRGGELRAKVESGRSGDCT